MPLHRSNEAAPLEPERCRDLPRAAPDREIDGLAILRRVAVGRTDASAVNGVNVGTAIEQERDHTVGAADARAVEGMPAGAVDVVDERGVRLKEGADAIHVARFGSRVNGMVRSCR